MIGADLSRAALLTLIPVLAWTGYLSMPALYLVAFAQGCLSVAFDLAYRSYLPVMIGPELLLAGNSRLQATDSISQTVGPALGGGLVQLMDAPFALLVDAASFLFSSASVIFIRAREPAPERDPQRDGDGALRQVASEIWSGLTFIWDRRMLRTLAVAGGTFNFFRAIPAHDLRAVRGALDAPDRRRDRPGVRWLRRGRRAGLGHGRPRGGHDGLRAAAGSGIRRRRAGGRDGTLRAGPAELATASFAGLFFLAGWGIVTLNVVSMTLRQFVTPGSLQARTNASFRFALSAATPAAAVPGGLLGASLGLRTALFITSAGLPLSVLWIVFSPVFAVRTLGQLAA